MRILNLKTLIYSLSMTLILCLPIFGGCKKSEVNKKKDKSDIPLIGTTWQLVGFASAKHYSIELAEPSGKETYLLIFNEDGSINGMTSTNQAGGSYTLKSQNKLNIIQFGAITAINELFDGRRYIEAMSKVSSYQISPNGLSLYYEKGIYLLFHPVEQ